MSLLTFVLDCFSGRRKVERLYRAGMAKAKKRDQQGAIEDYTMAIGSVDIPTDLKAMVLYNRALALAACDETPKAIEDLKSVIDMSDGPGNVMTMAKQKLAKLEPRLQKSGAR